ncbi:DEAD_2 family protein, partial [Vibrio harveyi]
RQQSELGIILVILADEPSRRCSKC